MVIIYLTFGQITIARERLSI